MTKTFYCDKETFELIDEARKLNPHFNLSLFVKNSLKNIAGQEKRLDIDFINLNSSRLSKELERIQEEIAYWKSQEVKYYKILQEEKQRTQEELEYVAFSNRVQEFLKNLNEEQEKEYREGLNTKWKSYYQYALFKIKGEF